MTTTAIALQDLVATNDAFELQQCVLQAADAAGYFTHLDVAFDFLHYGRHAELAEAHGLHELAKLFRAAWTIEADVFLACSDDEKATAIENILHRYR